MTSRTRVRFAALVLAGLTAVACGRNQADEEATARAVKVEPIEGTDVSRVTLTEEAANRIDIQIATVRSAVMDGATRKVVPYAAILYDAEGQAWAYTSPEQLIFVRAPVTVAYVVGDLAILSDGPAVGAKIVTTGAAELYGSEEEFEEE